MYARQIKNELLTFQVSGMLWNRSLVMRDLETGSLWSHILGECQEGPHLGAKLSVIPSVITSWKDWSTRFPNSSVLNLPRTAREYVREIFVRSEEFVFGIEAGGHTKAYPLSVLFRKPVIEDELNGIPIVVAFDRDSAAAYVLGRRVNGQTLSFLPELGERLLIDTLRGGRWKPWSGRAADRELSDARLPRHHGMISFKRAWFTFHPNSLTAE